MNSTFKVVFNKARGALMVVNEVTSSVQAKGTKTVVATAVAAMIAGVAGTAMAADKVIVNDQKGETVELADNTIATKFDVQSGGSVLGSGKNLTIKVNGATNAGTIGSKTAPLGTVTVGQTYDLTNAATGAIYAAALTAEKGSTFTNKGTVATNALNIDGTVKTGILSKDNGHLLFTTANLNEGGKIVITEYLTGSFKNDEDETVTWKSEVDKRYKAVAGKDRAENMIVFGDGNLTFNGGEIEVVGYTGPLNIAAIGGDANDKNIVFNKGTYEFGTVELYQMNEVTIGEAAGKSALDLSIGSLLLKNTSNIIQSGKVEIANTLDVQSALTIKGDAQVKAKDVKVANVAGENPVTLTIGEDTATAFSTEFGSIDLAASTPAVTVGEETTPATVGGKLVVKAGANTIGTLTVNKGAEAELASADIAANEEEGTEAFDGFVKVKTLTNAGKVTLGAQTEVEKLTNDLTLNLNNGSKVGALTNSKTGTVNVASGSVTVTNLTNEAVAATDTTAAAAGIIKLVDGSILNIKGASTNAGKIDGNVSTNTTPEFKGKVALTGELVNTGIIQVAEVEIGKGGKLTTSFELPNDDGDSPSSYVYADSVTVKKGGTYNATALNGMFDDAAGPAPKTETKPAEVADALVLAVIPQLTLEGGAMTVNGAALDNIKVAVAEDSTITISSGDYKVAALNVVSGGAVEVDGGSLDVTGMVRSADSGAISVADGAALKITAEGIGLKITKNEAGTDETVTTAVASTASGAAGVDLLEFNTIDNAGTITLAGLDGKTVLASTIGDIKTAVQGTTTGWLELGKLTVDFGSGADTGYDAAKNTLTAAAASDLAGVRLDQFKNTTVTTSESGASVAGSFGALAATDASGSFAIDGVLELNGVAGTNNLVSDKNGKVAGLTLTGTLTTTAANGVIGGINAGESDDQSGALTVAEGALTVEGDVKVNTLVVDGKMTMTEKPAVAATDEASGQDAVPYTLEATTIEVGAAGALNVQDQVTLGSGESTILGEANLGKLAGEEGSVVNVGSAEAAGKLVVGEVGENVQILADPAWDENGVEHASEVAVKTVASGAQVEAGLNSIVAVGTTDIQAAYNALRKTSLKIADPELSDNNVNSVLFVTGNPEVNADTGAVINYKSVEGNLIASDRQHGEDGSEIEANKVSIGADSLLIIDMANFDKKADENQVAVFAGEVEVNGAVYLDNIVNGETIKFAEEAEDADIGGRIYFTGDLLMVPDITDGNSFTLKMISRDDLEDEDEGITSIVGFDAAYAYFESGANLNNNSKSAQFNNWLWSELGAVSEGYDTVAKLAQVADDVASIAGTAGMVNVTMDALSQFNDTVAARTSILAKNGEGVNVWADVNGGKFEGKKVIAGAGYSSDIYAGVLGVDTTVACGAKIGAALTIGTADTDSKNTSAVTSMDSDLVGFSVYTSKTFGDIWNVAADIGYIQASNEVTTKAYNLGKFDADSNAFTFGIRGEVLTKAGALDIVPHAGLRYTRVDVDGFEAGFVTDYEAMNVFQLPVGVTVSGELEAAGWTIAPAFDLTFVPTWGDKNADLTIGINGSSVREAGTLRVLDSNVVNATLGVAAQNGAWTFGLDYKLGVGSDDRMNNSFNARVNYAF